MAILDGSEFNAGQYGPQSVFDRGRVGMMAEFRGGSSDAAIQSLQMNDQLMRKREQDMHLASMQAQQEANQYQANARKTQLELSNSIQAEASKYSDWINQRPDQAGQVIESIMTTTGGSRERVLSDLGLDPEMSPEQVQDVFSRSRSRSISTAEAEQKLELEGVKQAGQTGRKVLDITSDQYIKEREFIEERAKEMRKVARAQADQKYAEYTDEMIGTDDTAEVTKTSLTGIQAQLPDLFNYDTLEFDPETGLPDDKEAGQLNTINSIVAENAVAASRNDQNRYRMATTEERARMVQQGLQPRDISSYLAEETHRIVGRIDEDKNYYPPGPGGQDTAEFTKIRDTWIKKHYNSKAFQDEIRVQVTNGTVLLKAGKEYQGASPMEQAAMEKDLKMQMHNAMKGKATSDFSDPIARGFARGSEFDPARKMGAGLYSI